MNFSPIDQMLLPNIFSVIEKQSIYQALCAIRAVGQHDAELKESVINDVLRIIRFTENDRILSRNLSQQQMTDALKVMNDPKKLYLARFISNVALAGGSTPKEEKMAYFLFDMFEIPKID